MAGLEKVVTDELVAETADRLLRAGGKVTNRLIWTEIGGGSMTTIANALRRWRENQELKAEAPAERAPLPEVIAEAMRDATDKLWKAAQVETQKEIDALTQAMNERVANANAERDSALAELQAAAEELEAVKVQLDDADTLAQQQTEAASLAQADVARLTGELVAATDAAHSTQAALVEVREQVVMLTGLLEQQRAATAVADDQVKQAEGRAGKAEQATAAITATLEAVQAQLAKANERVQGLTDRVNEQLGELMTARSEAMRFDEHGRRVGRDLDEAKAAEKAARAEARKAIEEAAELRGRLAAIEEVRKSEMQKQEATADGGPK